MFQKQGYDWPKLRGEMDALKAGDYSWRAGRLPSYVWGGDDGLLAVQREAYGMFMAENALGKARAFPSLAKMERDVLDIVLDLLGGRPCCAGLFASGGTESILLAVKAARDWARAKGSFNEPFKIVAAETAHPALERAGLLMGIEIDRVELRPDGQRADVQAMSDAINANTIMLYGSAPNFPTGVFDPIEELGSLASRNNIWLHVDACVGGFLAPFARMNGADIPPFDMSVDGVTSLSADLHKYGYCAKGASTLLLRSEEHKRYAGFSFDWAKGTYATEGLGGTRPGGAIACAWAVLRHLGIEGYCRLTEMVLDTTDELAAGIDRIDGLEVVRPYDLSVLSYTSSASDVDTDAVAQAFADRGWFVGRSLLPVSCIQMAVTTLHAPIVERFLADLSESVHEVRSKKLRGTFDKHSY